MRSGNDEGRNERSCDEAREMHFERGYFEGKCLLKLWGFESKVDVVGMSLMMIETEEDVNDERKEVR